MKHSMPELHHDKYLCASVFPPTLLMIGHLPFVSVHSQTSHSGTGDVTFTLHAVSPSIYITYVTLA